MKQLLRIASRYHLISLGVAGAILAACLVQVPQMDKVPTIPNIDKIVHFTMFFTFSLLFIIEQWLVNTHWWKRPIPLFLLAFVFSAFWVASLRNFRPTPPVTDRAISLIGTSIWLVLALPLFWPGFTDCSDASSSPCDRGITPSNHPSWSRPCRKDQRVGCRVSQQ